MSTTYTQNVKLGQPALGDTGWSTPLNNNCTTLDGLAPVGGLAVTLHEVPSTSLNVAVAAGTVIEQSGTTLSYAGSSSFAMTGSATNVLYLDGTASWALTAAASYPTTPHVKLATVVAGSSTITSITDNRQSFNVAGTIADGTNWSFGTSTGTKIGTATTQKLGFFNATPVVQQTMGAATASSSYTSVEQGMLQAVYNAVRALGFGN
jgi:hypothetical protein